MKRVVVTGLGAISAQGDNVLDIWTKVQNGISGISTIQNFEILNSITVKFGGEIKKSSLLYSHFSASDFRKNDLSILYALYAAEEAIKDSQLHNIQNKDDIGVFVGSGIGGLGFLEKNLISLQEKGKTSPFLLPGMLINLIGGQIAMKYKYTGVINSFSTACATGTNAIGEAYKYIQSGTSKIIIAGGSEGALTNIGISGFACMNALSERNGNPKTASRPWDKDRDGFVISDGAALLVLEEYEHAKARGAKIYAEITGYGISADAHHITSPDPNGRGAGRAMKMALSTAKQKLPNYINAHGTSTIVGDEVELRAIYNTFGDEAKKINISSTKSTTGHLLGATGALEVIFSVLSIQEGVIPPTVNLDNPSEYAKDWNLTANEKVKKEVTCVLSNSFGFGGYNACLIIEKIQ